MGRVIVLIYVIYVLHVYSRCGLEKEIVVITLPSSLRSHGRDEFKEEDLSYSNFFLT